MGLAGGSSRQLVPQEKRCEGLADRQAADAVRARIDWKYALALELTDSGFDASVLCDFRARLLAGGAEQRLFEQMLLLFKDQGLVKAKGRQRTDATHVLVAIHVLNRLECIGETLRHALNTLATSAPSGCEPGCHASGTRAMAAASRSIACPMRKPTTMRWPKPGGLMGVISSRAGCCQY